MSYLDEAGLARYDGLLKDLALRDGADPSLLNWQKTAVAGAVSFLPVPEMPLDPVVNFAFTESGPASGTKSPDNPSTIAGVTQAKVTRCGKNLIWTPWQDATTVTRDGITWTVNGDGTVTANGTATADSYFNVRQSTAGNRQHIDSGLTYALSGCPASGSNATYLLAFVCNSATFKDFGAGTTCSVNADDSGWISCIVRSGVTVSNLVFKPQLELGSTATSFEPYEGADYTVNLGGTYYGGSVDLSAGTMTVTWYGEQISDAYTTYEVYTNTLVVGIEATKGHQGNVSNISNYLVTDKFPSINGSEDIEHCRFSGGTGVARYVFNIYVNKSRLDVSAAVDPSSPTTAEWFAAARAWMQNNPVFACYRLFTPEIIQLTPTQIYSLSQLDPYAPRINTVYSDQTSVQVGYPKSPQATQNELTSAIVSLGGNV